MCAPAALLATGVLSKLHALTLVGSEHQTHDYYMTIGPMFADPSARQLYAEIASIEEQHVTQYESLCDPRESVLEKRLLHEACEAYNYWSCVESETDPRVKAIWERMLDYELGHVHHVAELFERFERRDAAAVIDAVIRQPIEFEPHREFVRDVLRREVGLGASGRDLVRREERTRADAAVPLSAQCKGTALESRLRRMEMAAGCASGWTFKYFDRNVSIGSVPSQASSMPPCTSSRGDTVGRWTSYG